LERATSRVAAGFFVAVHESVAAQVFGRRDDGLPTR
jgi:hypothetical protein